MSGTVIETWIALKRRAEIDPLTLRPHLYWQLMPRGLA